jgi:hypothetical protein
VGDEMGSITTARTAKSSVFETYVMVKYDI